jgi:hypothetical protein
VALRRASTWAGACLLIVLATRWLAYELSPAPTALAAQLQGVTAPPEPLIVAAVAVGLAFVLSALGVWLASMGVRERQRLAPRFAAPAPISPVRVALHAVALFAASALLFDGLESYIHYREGLGFHGLHCLLGPVHEDALPLLGAFSTLASAAIAVVRHVTAWLRRAVERLAELELRVAPTLVVLVPAAATTAPSSALPGRSARPRGPPASVD